MILVCPKCRAGKIVSNRTYGIICAEGCGYFSKENSLQKNEAIKIEGIGRVGLINKTVVEIKADWEKRAYEWKDEQLKKRERGEVLSHEPRK
jgi:hypothetical protein